MTALAALLLVVASVVYVVGIWTWVAVLESIKQASVLLGRAQDLHEQARAMLRQADADERPVS